MAADFSVSLSPCPFTISCLYPRTHSAVRYSINSRRKQAKTRYVGASSAGTTLSSELLGRQVALQVKRMEMKTLGKKIGEGVIKERKY
jgi:hypothetical protein